MEECFIQKKKEECKNYSEKGDLRLPGVEPGSIAWKAIILTVGLQTLDVSSSHILDKILFYDTTYQTFLLFRINIIFKR